MAYPTVSGPYGLLPQNLIGGQVFAGSTRMIPIASGYGTGLYYGDVVQIGAGSGVNAGAVIQSTMTYNTTSAVAGTVGIFLGCEYTPGSTLTTVGSGPIYGKTRAQYWPASTTANDAQAYVLDDPDVVMKAVVVANNGTTSSTTQLNLGPAWVGSNLFLVRNAGSNTTGNSAFALCAGSSDVRTASTAPFRVVGIVPETAVSLSQTATTATSTAMTLSAANSNIVVGMNVYGSGIPTGTYVSAVSGTSVTLSQASTSSVTGGSFTFVGSPEVLVKWNFGYHGYYNATGV